MSVFAKFPKEKYQEISPFFAVYDLVPKNRFHAYLTQENLSISSQVIPIKSRVG